MTIDLIPTHVDLATGFRAAGISGETQTLTVFSTLFVLPTSNIFMTRHGFTRRFIQSQVFSIAYATRRFRTDEGFDFASLAVLAVSSDGIESASAQRTCDEKIEYDKTE